MGMSIKPSEIDSVESIGSLDGQDVSMVRTHGGLYLAVGKLKGKKAEEVLAAGSHPAIVRFNIEKSHSSFQPSLMKSEKMDGEESIVNQISDFLPEEMTGKGYDFYIVKKSNNFEFVLTKSQIEVLKYDASIVGEDLIVEKANKVITSDLYPVANAAVRAAAIIAIDENKSILHANKRYDPSLVLKK